jgi:hypothetical protein
VVSFENIKNKLGQNVPKVNDQLIHLNCSIDFNAFLTKIELLKKPIPSNIPQSSETQKYIDSLINYTKLKF